MSLRRTAEVAANVAIVVLTIVIVMWPVGADPLTSPFVKKRNFVGRLSFLGRQINEYNH